MTFNFHHLKIDYDEGKKWNRGTPDRIHLKKIFSEWQRGMHGLAWNALFWCNHDQPRIVSRLGDDGPLREVSAKMLAMVLHGMQGTPYIFQGEEIGMTDPHFQHIDQYRDVESLNIYQSLITAGISQEHVLAILEKKSRDNSRTPVQWDTSVNAGFTSGKSWIDVADNYDVINVEQERLNEHSVLNTYRRLIELRKSLPVLTLGDYTDMDPLSESIWCYKREDGDNSLLVLANLTPDTVSIDDYFGEKQRWRLLYGNYGDAQNSVASLRPYECMWWMK